MTFEIGLCLISQLYLRVDVDAEVPRFNPTVKELPIQECSITLYFTNQCPHAEKYARLIEEVARDNNVSFNAIKLLDAESAQRSPAPFTTYSLFIKGTFITNEILTEKKFGTLLEAYKLV